MTTPSKLSPDLSQPCRVDCYDDLPLWSAPFGLALLDAVRMRPGLVALDVGSGTGFPLVELAQRLGASSRVCGVDPWREGLERTRRKLAVWGVRNVEVVEAPAEALPFGDNAFDLVVSNNGLNNVQDAPRALAECARVSRPGAQLVFTFNLPESMHELYDVLADLFRRGGDGAALERMQAHIAARRQPVDAWRRLLDEAGFHVAAVERREFTLRFADARAVFEHGFMALAFVPSWLEIVDATVRDALFAEVRARLDATPAPRGGIALTIPFARIDATRIGR